MAKEYVKKITQGELLQLGWTKKLIEQLLPEPELKSNPHYKKAPKMRLWEKDDVENAMQSQDFIDFQKYSEKRRQSAKKAVETKIDKMMNEVKEKIKNINVKFVNDDRLIIRTLKSKEEYMISIEKYDYPTTKEEVGEAVLQRWIVNYIRHELTSYDDELYEMSGKVGCHQAYLIYRESVLMKIAEVYPKYSDECIKQIDGYLSPEVKIISQNTAL
jgi:hypothetical protein